MPTYKWFYRGLTFNSDSAELYSRGVMKLPKAYNQQGIIWDKAKREEGYDVIVYDWDGTILAHWTAESFLKLTEMPTLHRTFYRPIGDTDADIIRTEPAYEGEEPLAIEPAGYNWTLEEAQVQVRAARFCDIGCIYDSGTTNYIWIRAKNDNASYEMLGVGNSGPYEFDYGDGSDLHNVGGFGRTTGPTHTYAARGLYLLTIKGGGSIRPGWNYASGSYVMFASMKEWVYSNASWRDVNKDIEFVAMFCGSNFNPGSAGCMIGLEFRYFGIGAGSNSSTYNGMCNDWVYIRHLTIPRYITSYSASQSYYYGIYYMTFFRGGEYLETISYPPTWRGPSGFSSTLWSLKRYVLPASTTNPTSYGGLEHVETAVICGSNISSNSFATGTDISGIDFSKLTIWCLEKDYDTVVSAVGNTYAPYVKVIEPPI